MTEDNKKDPAEKMRNLLNGGKASPVARLPKKNVEIPASLPKKNDEVSASIPKKDNPAALPKAVSLPHKEVTPAKMIMPMPTPTQQPSQQKKSPLLTLPKPASAANGLKFNFGPPFWTIASILSMTVNIILVIVLLALLINIKNLNMGSALNIGNSLLGGLFTNFEKMDRASITTDVKVETTIPVKFDLQLNQQTNVVLSQDVTITNARVTVNTGGLNISNALTTIVLPKDTSLPVVLNLTVPVDTTVPVTLNVPVNIPLAQTQLHEPFVGLQDVVRPFYCMINPNAVNLSGQRVCP
jgi:hypothetical protein